MTTKSIVLFNFTTLLLFTIALSSCISRLPKEVKSPCVAAPSDDYYITPCIRRPVNSLKDIV
jgi:hypothetical protein